MNNSEPAGSVITFYSYKGGTGRSMALANIAWILASNDKRVLMIDWDLEAPGLHRYFHPFLVDPNLVDTEGLIDYLWKVTRAIMTEPPKGRTSGSHSSGSLPDIFDYKVSVEWPFQGRGYLDLIPAGRQGSNYPQRINAFDWENFYERLGGGQVLTAMRDQLLPEYDYILIDSRTGVSDTSGICTVQMPDKLIGFLTLNNQSIEGVATVFEAVLKMRDPKLEGELQVYPVVTRVEDGEQEKLTLARNRARGVFAEIVRKIVRNQSSSERRYWDEMEIPYKKFYAFEEVLATFGDPAGSLGSNSTMLSAMERVARRVTGEHDLSMPEMSEEDRQINVEKFGFEGGKTEEAPKAHVLYFLSRVANRQLHWEAEGRPTIRLLSEGDLWELADHRAQLAVHATPELENFITISEIVRDYGKRLVDIAETAGGIGGFAGFVIGLITVISAGWSSWLVLLIYPFLLYWAGYVFIRLLAPLVVPGPLPYTERLSVAYLDPLKRFLGRKKPTQQ